MLYRPTICVTCTTMYNIYVFEICQTQKQYVTFYTILTIEKAVLRRAGIKDKKCPDYIHMGVVYHPQVLQLQLCLQFNARQSLSLELVSPSLIPSWLAGPPLSLTQNGHSGKIDCSMLFWNASYRLCNAMCNVQCAMCNAMCDVQCAYCTATDNLDNSNCPLEATLPCKEILKIF